MSSFIAALKQRLPEADWPVVVSSLRNQPQIWQQIQDADFSAQVLQVAGAERAHWSPAYLGLLALGHAPQFDVLRETPIKPVSEKLRYDAAAAYERIAKSADQGRPMPDLAEATLLALALRERQRMLNGWDQLTDDLSVATIDFWELPIACLLGLIPAQHELLRYLLSPDQPEALQPLALHALVSNPLTLDVQVAHLSEIIAEYQLPNLLKLLRKLAPIHSSLAQHVAAQVLEDLQNVPVDGRDGLSEIQSLLLQAEIYQLGGQADRAAALLQSAWQATQQLQVELGAKVAEATGEEVPMLVAVQQTAELVNPRTLAAGKVATRRPAALLSAARVALESQDRAEAKELAIAALNSTKDNAKAEEGYEKAKLLRDLGSIFAELDLPQEAEMAAKTAIELQANDADSAAVLSRMLMERGALSEALDNAQLASALAPQRADLRRDLATALGANQQFEEAYIEWKAAIGYSEQPTTQDWLAFAAAAFASEHIDEAISACRELLIQEPANGTAYALMGKAVAAQGDETSAIDYLRRACELAPADLPTWLSLATLLRDQQRHEETLAALQSAQKYCAPSAKVQAMMAEIYHNQVREQEALAAYRYAANLASEQTDGETAQLVALQLSALQYRLREVVAARNTLETAQKGFPGNLEITRQFGKLLLETEEPKRALNNLVGLLTAKPEDLDLLMDVAKAQLALQDHQGEAEHTLQAILTHKDAPSEAIALLAEAYSANGKHLEAIKQYDKALKSDLAHDSGWSKKLILGKAATQAACGRPVAAIATLEGIEKTYADDLDVLRALCTAYKRAGRVEEAALLAEKSLNSGNDEHGLIWYAETMQELGKSAEACKAINSKSKGVIDSPQMQLALAKLKWDGESKKASLGAFSKLLGNGEAESLREAAEFLFTHNAAEDSIAFYQRSIELSEADAELLTELTQACIASGQYEQALETLNQAILVAPHKPQLFELKADLLQRLGKPQAALQALAAALDLLPNDVAIVARKASLLRETGDLGAALAAAAQAFELDPADPNILQTAAELAVLCLEPERASGFFATAKLSGTATLELLCLQAELALEAGNEIEAAKLVAQTLDANDKHPRVLSLQAQLAACRGDNTQADHFLRQALESKQEAADPLSILGVAKAAERVSDWQTAIRLYETTVNEQPGILAGHFALGRAVVLRAEWQRLCEASGANVSKSNSIREARSAAKKAFTAAAALANNGSTQAQISGWQTRAELRLGGTIKGEDLPPAFPSTPGEAAALFAANSASENRISNYWETPEVLIERGLASSEGSFELFAKAAKQLPNFAPVQALAAFAAQAAGETSAALQAIRRALSIWAQQPRWQDLAGQIQLTLGALLDAAQHFQQAVELDPQEAKHHFALGQAQMATKDLAAATSSLQKAIELEPHNADYLLALAVAYRHSGDGAHARSLAAKASKAAPRNVTALLMQAELALESSDSQAAIAFTESALTLAPKDANALRLFAEALHGLGQTADALAVLERASEAADDEVPVLIRKAQLQPEVRRLDALVKLSQKHQERPEVFLALSETLAQNGVIVDAIQAGQHAAKKAASLPQDQQARLHLHLGMLLKQNGNLDQSLHHLDEAAQLDPHSATTHLERGRVFLARRQQAQALAAFRQAAATAPQLAESHYEAGMALKDAKDYTGAEIELRHAARLAPRDRDIQKQLAAVIALNLVHHPAPVGAEL